MSSKADIQPLMVKAQHALQANNYQQAEHLLKHALSIQKKNPDALFLLANIYKSSNRKKEAIKLYEKTIKIAAKFSPALLNLSLTLAELGDYKKAITICDKALKLRSSDADFLNIKGRALIELGNPKDALAVLEQAITSNPEHAASQNNKGIALRNLGQLTSAKNAFQVAVELAPNDLQHLINFANIHSELDLVDDAINAYQEILRLDPNLVLFQFNLYSLLEASNKLEVLGKDFPAVLARFPNDPGINFIQAKLEARNGNYIEASERIKKHTNSTVASASMKARMLLELGKYQDKLQAYDEAFLSFTLGNKFADENSPYSTEYRNKYHERMQSYLTDSEQFDFSKWNIGYNSDRPAPIFIMGFARSGTTLLGQILNGHPDLVTSDENPMLGNTIAQMTAGEFEGFEDLDRLDGSQLEDLRAQYFNQAKNYVNIGTNQILVDKNPMLTPSLAFIQRVFPDSKVIFVERHPCDVVLSCYMQFFSSKTTVGNVFTLEQIASTYDAVMTLGRKYLDSLPLNIKTFRYEDVVTDYETAARDILSFVDLAWHDDILNYKEESRKREKRIATPSYHQVTKDIYFDAKHRWQKYTAQLEPILPVLKPHAKAMGYEI